MLLLYGAVTFYIVKKNVESMISQKKHECTYCTMYPPRRSFFLLTITTNCTAHPSTYIYNLLQRILYCTVFSELGIRSWIFWANCSFFANIWANEWLAQKTSNLLKNERFAHFWWATWAIHSWSLIGFLSKSLAFLQKMSEWAICSKNERFAHLLISGDQPERYAHIDHFGERPDRFAHIAH